VAELKAARANKDVIHLLHLALMARGTFIASRGYV